MIPEGWEEILVGRKSRSTLLLEKSVQAALSAIELYNKPNYLYREESFAILMVNAWELLLKAKIVFENDNKLSSIYIKDDNAKRKDGKKSKAVRFKESRSGNKMTLELTGAINKLTLPPELKVQLETLIEIRDNAIHFYNESKFFEKKLLEVGTATLKSYIIMLNQWFDYPISQHNLFLIPLAFNIPDTFDAGSILKESKSHQLLLQYIKAQEGNLSGTDSEHSISLVIDVKFSRNTIGFPVQMVKDADIKIAMDSEEKFKNHYRWNYRDDLLPRLKKRYSDFKIDKKFFNLKKDLEQNPSLSSERHLDWKRQNGTKKRFYSPDIINEFDKHYTKRK